MRMLRVVAGLAAAAAVPAGAQTVSKAEIRSQPPERTADQLRDQLWGALVLEDQRSRDPSWRLRNVLKDVPLVTRVYPTRHANLCRRDWISIKFAPADRTIDPESERADAATPVIAHGLDASREYRAVGPVSSPGRGSDLDAEWDAGRGWRECGMVQAGDGFLAADGDYDAADVIRIWQLAAAAVAEGKVKPECSNGRAEADCRKRFDDAIAGVPMRGEQCETGEDNVRRNRCYTYMGAHYRMVIRMDWSQWPGTVASVKLLDMVLIDDSALELD